MTADRAPEDGVVRISVSGGRRTEMRSVSLSDASEILHDAGLLSASEFVLDLPPMPASSGGSPVIRFVAVATDGEVVARSIRRAGLRYVARLLRLLGAHRDAASYLESCADSVPAEGALRFVSYARGGVR
jgi:hypothetical protein